MKKLLSLLSIYTLILTSVFSLTSCNPERDAQYSKQITTSDVLIDQSVSIINPAFIVHPQVDIDNLTITISFYDKDNYPVAMRTHKLGKAIAGQEYYIEIDSLSQRELSNISHYKFTDAEGTIWIEQETKGICLEHKYDDGFINKNATCNSAGEKIYSCTNCGYKQSSLFARSQHNWVYNKYGDFKFICSHCCVQSNSKS